MEDLMSLFDYIKQGDFDFFQKSLSKEAFSEKELVSLIQEIWENKLPLKWIEAVCKGATSITEKVWKLLIGCDLPVGRLLRLINQQILPGQLMVASKTDGMNMALWSLLENGTFNQGDLNEALENAVSMKNFIGVAMLMEKGANPKCISENAMDTLKAGIYHYGGEEAAVYLLLTGGKFPLDWYLSKEEE